MSTRPSPRAQALADRLIHGADALIVLAGSLTETEWRTRLHGDGRKVGVIVHHVASVYPVETQLARTAAQGRTITGVLPADIDTMNAAHALDHDAVTQEATIAVRHGYHHVARIRAALGR